MAGGSTLLQPALSPLKEAHGRDSPDLHTQGRAGATGGQYVCGIGCCCSQDVDKTSHSAFLSRILLIMFLKCA